jgi:formylglycine-generating enzyme required for sulfatase activity
MSRTLGQQIVIENIAGAGGTIATTRAKRAAHLRSGLDAPRLAEIALSRLWQPYGAPLARWALLATAQFLPLEVPEAARGRARRAFRDCDQCPEMVEIEPGYFFMGSPFTEPGRYLDESPRRLVMVGQPFAAGRFAVSQVSVPWYDRMPDFCGRARPLSA